MLCPKLSRYYIIYGFMAFITPKDVTTSDYSDDDTEFKYHSFQIITRAGKQECFYQHFQSNTSTSLIWHVMTASGEGELAVTVTYKRIEPNNLVLHESAYGQMGDFRTEGLDQGTYEICVDNESSYTQKKVYLWVDYQRQKAWDEAISEDDAIKKFEIKQDLVRDILRSLENRLRDMTYYQTVYRQTNFYDEAALTKLYSIVHYRSLIAFLMITVTAALQVFFIRRIFNTPANKSTNAGI